MDEIDYTEIESLDPRIEKAVSFDVQVSSADGRKNDCGCYGYKPCTCDTYAGCPKE
jgi:hypothetical protein